MSCGCPVIVGDRTAEKEIVKNGGILVDPLSVLKITKSIYKIKTNNRRYRKEALKDASKFSWDNYAKEFINVLSEYEK